jgi:Fur family peroxide stress response transcriptional regulator
MELINLFQKTVIITIFKKNSYTPLDNINNSYYYYNMSIAMDAKKRKHSSKRDAILEMVKSTTSHPSAQWVYEQLKPVISGLSLGTVYRNIGVFINEGSMVSVGVVNGEERFDARVQPHPHVVCSRCGRIADLPNPDDQVLRRLSEGMSAGEFSVEIHKTVFYGLCGDCTSNK